VAIAFTTLLQIWRDHIISNKSKLVKQNGLLPQKTLVGQTKMLIKSVLTPKRLDCVFWLYRNFGQVRVNEDLYILG